MMAWTRGAFPVAAILAMTASLAGCGSMGTQVQQNNLPQPQMLSPVQSSTVSSNALPPLGGTASPAQVAPGLSGTPVLGGVPATPPASTTYSLDPMAAPQANSGAPLAGAANTTTASAGDSSFVTLNDVGTPATSGPRDFSTGVTIEKLLGGWTVVSGSTQCRLNLTYTAKTGTNRYRASAPACAIPALGTVASWSLVGSGVQLFDEAGSIVAALQLSGNRFIGTVAGGGAISMAG